MEAPRQCQGAARGSPEEPGGVTEAAWRRLLALWGLPEEALGPAWETPSHFAAKSDSKLDDFAANFFEAVFV